MKELYEKAIKYYQNNFGEDYIIVRAPGRINLIGEHTDYNEGFVFPAAVGQEIVFAIGKSKDDDRCAIISLDFNSRFDFRLSEIQPLNPHSWENYIIGVASEIIQSGNQLQGFNLVFTGNVPCGAGMSSSAALECGTCYGLNKLFGLNLTRFKMIQLAQKAEHNFAGVKCGIMDQFASMMGIQGHALKLDCRKLEHEYFPIELETHKLLLVNSNVTHDLVDSEYNERRLQCEQGVKILSNAFPDVYSLRDVEIEQLQKLSDEMPMMVYDRCKYVIEENRRVCDFASALRQYDMIKAGALLREAQKGMKNEYEITCREIDFMSDFANSYNGILGSRMMGGGFGGCTINLIKKGKEEDFIKKLHIAYSDKFKKEITPIQIDIADGASLVQKSG